SLRRGPEPGPGRAGARPSASVRRRTREGTPQRGRGGGPGRARSGWSSLPVVESRRAVLGRRGGLIERETPGKVGGAFLRGLGACLLQREESQQHQHGGVEEEI